MLSATKAPLVPVKTKRATRKVHTQWLEKLLRAYEVWVQDKSAGSDREMAGMKVINIKATIIAPIQPIMALESDSIVTLPT